MPSHIMPMRQFFVNFKGRYKIGVLVIILLFIFLEKVVTAPARPKAEISAQHYLLTYGYLPQSGFEIRDQVSESRMKEAIENLQAFGNIPVTGEINAETLRLMKKPRCGVPDILSGQFRDARRRKRFIIQGQRWRTTNLTWSLKETTRSHPEDAVITELEQAFNVWSQNTPLKFSRMARENADDADIRIIFQRLYHDDGYPFDGKGSILAHAFFPGSGQGGDAHFDDDETWLVTEEVTRKDGTRLFAVAVHEFGHSLGLSHSNVEGALMYPWYQDFTYNISLHRDDELGIHQIYGSMGHFNPDPTYRPHRNRPDFETPSKPSRPNGKPVDGRPNTCDTSYDAISLIRQELFIFKGPYFWRINDNQLLKGYPSQTINMWQNLPSNLTHVDAVFEHKDVEIIFFIGKYFWRFNGTVLIPGYPKTLSSMGISPNVEKIDGAMIWGHNGKTYLFSGTKYWRLQEDDREFTVEPDYPRDMFVWRGVPYNVDSVFKWKDGNVYFFKDKVFFKFDDRHMRVESEIPNLSSTFWMGCTSNPINPRREYADSKAFHLPNNLLLFLSSIFLSFLFQNRLLHNILFYSQRSIY